MILGKANVASYLKLAAAKSFRIYDSRLSTKSAPVFIHEGGGRSEEAGAIKAFEEWAGLQSGGQYTMHCYKQSKAAPEAEEEGKGTLRVEFSLDTAQPLGTLGCAVGCQEVDREKLKAEIRAELKVEAELAELRAFKRENEGKTEGPGDRLMGFLENNSSVILPQIMGLFKGTPVGLAGMGEGAEVPDEAPTSGMTIELRQRFNRVLKRLLAKEPNLIDLLEKLADVAENNPGQFKFITQAAQSL